jgi:hypothetical protein
VWNPAALLPTSSTGVLVGRAYRGLPIDHTKTKQRAPHMRLQALLHATTRRSLQATRRLICDSGVAPTTSRPWWLRFARPCPPPIPRVFLKSVLLKSGCSRGRGDGASFFCGFSLSVLQNRGAGGPRSCGVWDPAQGTKARACLQPGQGGGGGGHCVPRVDPGLQRARAARWTAVRGILYSKATRFAVLLAILLDQQPTFAACERLHLNRSPYCE